jgi:monoamine oxidase
MSGCVVIVGAGLAGLTAARRLRQQGREVIVLEAADRIGGRLVRQEVAGVPVDGGGAWVGPTQDRVLALLDELGLEAAPTYDDGKHLARLGGRIRARSGPAPPLNPLALADALLAQLRLDRLAHHVEGARARALDARTIGQWIDRHVRTHGARTLLRIGVATTTGKEPAEVSLLAFTAHVRSAGGVAQLLGVRGAA